MGEVDERLSNLQVKGGDKQLATLACSASAGEELQVRDLCSCLDLHPGWPPLILLFLNSFSLANTGIYFLLSPSPVSHQPVAPSSSQLVLMIFTHFQPTSFCTDGLFSCFGYISPSLSALSSAFTL